MQKRITYLAFLFMLLMLSVIPAVSAQDMTFTESPMLAARVAAGELPPLEERLPITPQVTTPFNEIGQYGGELRLGYTGDPFWNGMLGISWERPLNWTTDFSGVEPSIFADWEVSDDATEYTFYLREGMKWSDGHPFTVEDILFNIEVIFDLRIWPGGAFSELWPTDSPDDFEAEAIDDYTVRFTFAEPQGLLTFRMAQWFGHEITNRPAHFLKQFHADYNPDVQELIDAEDGVGDWPALFVKYLNSTAEFIYFPPNPELLEYPVKPTLAAWMMVEELGTDNIIRFERNPYYWRVDSEGNQLPYIDSLIVTQYQDGETLTFAMLNGDIDYMPDAASADRILFFDAVDEGRAIRIGTPQDNAGVTNTIHLNLNVQDDALREVFRNRDFRIGLSHAINREEIIEIVHFGMSTPSQYAPLENSPLYNEQLATQFTEFDIDLANEYLDRVAPDRDSDGYRLGPDGERITFVLVSSDASPATQVGELISGYWDAVGVEALFSEVTDDVFDERVGQNTLQAVIWAGEGGAGLTSMLDPRYLVPTEYQGFWMNGSFAWRYGGFGDRVQVPLEGEFLEQRERYLTLMTLPTAEAQIEAMAEIIQVAADGFWLMGTARPIPGYLPIHTRIQNHPDEWTAGFVTGSMKMTRPEQWFIAE